MNSISWTPPKTSPRALSRKALPRERERLEPPGPAFEGANEAQGPQGQQVQQAWQASPLPPGAHAYSLEPSLQPLRVVPGKVPAGFPSPAEDFAVKRHDLNELLITHAMATFLWRVSGQSMTEAGIFDGDILVVNRALTPVHKDVVVAEVDGEFTVKYFYKRNGSIKLQPANPTYPEITFKEGQSLRICGVVTSAIKRFRKSAQTLD